MSLIIGGVKTGGEGWNNFSNPFLTSLDTCVLRSCFVGFGDPSGVVLKLR